MSEAGSTGRRVSAIEDFRRARFRAKLEQIIARITGQSADLLDYESVRRKLGARGTVSRGLQNIPIEAIVGSVGRYADFTRSFLPRQDEDEERWAQIKAAMESDVGLPPIEVYKIGEAYFVLDGNHRVSVARQAGAAYIQAYVTEVQTKIPLSPDVQPDDLIIKAEYAKFLERTGLDKIRPDADLSVSVPNQYKTLEEHIDVHRYFMGMDEKRDIPYQEAVAHWYDCVYMPVVQAINEQGILSDFPDRTETDLYLWVMEYRVELGKEMHWDISPEAAAGDLASRFSSRPEHVAARVGEQIARAVVPEAIVPGPAPGTWRQEQEHLRRQNRLFNSVLVAIGGSEEGWQALDQAIVVARHEGGRVTGLHVVAAEDEKERPTVHDIQAEFERRCSEAGIPGWWIVDAGSISSQICRLSRWVGLSVIHLAHPPGDQPIARLGSGLRSMIQHCAAPILAVPGAARDVERALLAYDGSPKADEALFVSTYLAEQWGISLVVLTTIENGRTTPDTAARARQYLQEHGTEATFIEAQGPAGEAILVTAVEMECDLIVMGGYGFNPVLEIAFGSTVDHVLRRSLWPVLICR
jgi:nucleotide-binding universal stress UspA family protein